MIATSQSAAPSGVSTADVADIAAVVAGRHGDPFRVLGPHAAARDGSTGIAVRTFVPDTRAAWIIHNDMPIAMEKTHPGGFFEGFLSGFEHAPRYRLRFESERGETYEIDDAYALSGVLSDFDLHLLGEGTHLKNYERMGAHLATVAGIPGVNFTVWAPNAKRVSVVGDFNHWDGRRNPMRFHPGVGVWEIFIPGLASGEKYKFELIGPEGRLLPLKSDPYGFFFEVRPQTASIVHDIDRYTWKDDEWMLRRAEANALDAPIAIYEVHLGSWMRDPGDPERLLSYGELAPKLVEYVQRLGFSHVQLMPVSEHPFDGSWGYQTLGYYAPTSRFGTPEDFMAFVDRLHQNGIGVLVDWVPAHFPRDDHGLRRFDGTCLFEHLDPRQGEHPDWGTQVFNYGRNEVANFLLGSVLFWLEKYHIDGIRVDAVASMLYLDYGRRDGEWVPNQYGGKENLEAIAFLKRFNEVVHLHHPGVLTVAEESTSYTGVSHPTYLGGLGFSMKWNMGWMNDTLRYMHLDPVFRKYHQNDLTFSMVYAFSENFVLPLSHDEVVHGKGALLDKMPGDFHQRFANLRLLLAYMYGHPGKKLLFMGGEIGQWREWKYQHSLDWHLLEYEPHQGIQRFVTDLNMLLQTEPALYEDDFKYTGFEWVDFHDADSSIIAFLRKGKNERERLLFVFNFTPVARHHYRLGVPTGGLYRELLNSDSSWYGGGNLGNGGGVQSGPHPWHSRPESILITLPPLSALVFKPA